MTSHCRKVLLLTVFLNVPKFFFEKSYVKSYEELCFDVISLMIVFDSAVKMFYLIDLLKILENEVPFRDNC